MRACLRKVTDRYSEVFSKALGAPLKVSIGHTLQNRHLHIMLWNMQMQNTTVHGRRMGTVVDDPECIWILQLIQHLACESLLRFES